MVAAQLLYIYRKQQTLHFCRYSSKTKHLEMSRTRKELSVAREPKSLDLYFAGFITKADDCSLMGCFQMASWQPSLYPPKIKRQPCWCISLCKYFPLFQYICMAAGHGQGEWKHSKDTILGVMIFNNYRRNF